MTNAKFLYFVSYGLLGLALGNFGLSVFEKPIEVIAIFVLVGLIDFMSAITATEK